MNPIGYEATMSPELEEAYLKGQDAKMISWDSKNPFNKRTPHFKAWNRGFNQYHKKTFRPTHYVLEYILLATDFDPDEFFNYSSMEFIDFNENQIHLKSGKIFGFKGLTEKEFIEIIDKRQI